MAAAPRRAGIDTIVPKAQTSRSFWSCVRPDCRVAGRLAAIPAAVRRRRAPSALASLASRHGRGLRRVDSSSN